MRTMLCLTHLWLLAPASALAQASADTIAGVVIGPDERAVAGANVFLLETLEGDLTGADGRFAIPVEGSGEVTLVVLREGFREARRAAALPTSQPIAVRLERSPIPLDPIVAQAGRVAAGSDPRLELTSLDVVTAPGAAADVYRVFQTFPGLQSVDEGAGLFVRGGDVFETKIFLDGAVVLSPYRYESPTGGFFGSFDPFLLDGIQFSTGGFGARYGDALSGAATLTTLGRPQQASGGATVSLASASATAAVPLPSGGGVRATATRSNTDLLFRVNGSTAEFTDPPAGRDLSGSAVWEYRPGAELKLFGMDQWSRLGVMVDDPSYREPFETDERQDIAVLSWRDRFGGATAGITVATAGDQRSQELGALRLSTAERLRQASGHTDFDLGSRLAVTVGAEVERRTSTFDGELPDDHYDGGDGSPTSTLHSALRGTRHGFFAQANGYASERLRLTAGLRTDHSTLSRQRTWDPRLSASYRAADQLTLLAAWGVYHQVPAPYLYAQADDEASLPPMRATHLVAGVQIGSEDPILRVEAYAKRYADLAQEERDGHVVPGGRGTSRGLDVFVQWPEWRGFSGRTGLSVLRATRTDPNTGSLARSPLEIARTWTSIVEKRLGDAWLISATERRASGRPFTPVVDASYDATRDVWVPRYGEPNAERLPAFRRIDLAASRLVPLGGRRLLVVFAAVNNLLDRRNVHDVTYSEDYSELRRVRSHFNRSFYLGARLTF